MAETRAERSQRRRLAALRRTRASISRIWSQAQRAPLAWSVVVCMWALYWAHGGNPAVLRQTYGLSTDLVPLRLLTSGLTAAYVPQLVLCSVLAFLILPRAERVLGLRKTALVAVLSQLVGTIGGLGLAEATRRLDPAWGQILANEWLLSPVTWQVGMAGYLSAWLGRLWRRRVRVVILLVVLSLFLYAGVLADFPRVVSGIFGIVAGFLATGRPRDNRVSIPEVRVLVSFACVTIAVGPLLTLLNPGSAGPFSVIGTLVWSPDISLAEMDQLCTQVPSARTCFALLTLPKAVGLDVLLQHILPLIFVGVLSIGLRRGRFSAWLATCVAMVTVGSFFLLVVWLLQQDPGSDLFTRLNTLGVILPWLIGTAILVATRRYFPVRVARATIRRFFARSALAAVAAAALRVGVIIAFPSGFSGTPTFKSLLIDAPFALLPGAFGDALDNPIIATASWSILVTRAIAASFWLLVAYELYQVQVSFADPAASHDREHAAELLRHGTGDHLSWMTLWEGNRYFFASDDRGYVAYRVHGSVAVTVGEPVVRYEAEKLSVGQEFEAFCAHQGLTPAFYSVRENFSNGMGLKKLQVAEESVVHVTELAFTGKKFQDVRTARNRAQKEGIRAEWMSWESAGPEIRTKIVALSEEWVSEKALPEMGFTLGGIEQLQDPEVQLMVALDAEDHVHGVTSWLPVFEQGELAGWTLDFMRRDPQGFRPVVELLIAETIVQVQGMGVEWISLSGAPLAHSQDGELNPVEAVLEWVGARMEPLYGFRSLAFFKKKFQPVHVPWLLGYREDLQLPSIGVAVSRCYLPNVSAPQAVQVARAYSAGLD